MIGSFSWLLLTVTIQVTILAMVVAGIQRFVLRNDPKASARLISFGMTLILAVSAVAILPVPSWFDYVDAQTAAPNAVVRVSETNLAAGDADIEDDVNGANKNADRDEGPRHSAEPLGWANTLKDFASQFRTSTSESNVTQFSWLGKGVRSFGVCLLVLVFLAFARLFIGIQSLRRLRSNS